MERFLNELTKKGLSHVFKMNNGYWARRNDLEKLQINIVVNYPNILEGRIDELPYNAQSSIVELMIKHRPDLFFNEYWSNYVHKLVNKIIDGKDEDRELLNNIYDRSDLFFLASKIRAELDDEFSWMQVLGKFVIAHNRKQHVGQVLPKITDRVAKAEPKEFVKFIHRRDCVSYGRRIRSHLYDIVITNGLLDKKIARRIRSDASQYTSEDGARLLFNNLDKYSKDMQQELILQFSDTRHDNVAILMARETPEELLPYLVGLKSPRALRILEKRLDAIADREERLAAAKKNESS